MRSNSSAHPGSTDGGATWTGGGTLPAGSAGDAGDPVLARDSTSGCIYFATLGFTNGNVIQVFRSTDNGAIWVAPLSMARPADWCLPSDGCSKRCQFYHQLVRLPHWAASGR